MKTVTNVSPVEISGSMPDEVESIIEKCKEKLRTQALSGFDALKYLRALGTEPDQDLRVYSRFIKLIQPGGSDFEKDKCESCGMWIKITGGYQLDGLPGVYHDLFCLEQGIFHKDEPQRGGSKDAQLGTGQLLRSYITELSEQEAANASGGVCGHCGGTLIGCRADAKYCCESCRQMARAKLSGTAKKPIKNPIKQGDYPYINPEVGMSGHPA